MSEIVATLKLARPRNGKPKAIVARTLPGKGVASIENCEKAHFLNVSHIDWNQAIQELEEQNG